MGTTGHETEAINVRGLKASLKKGGNIGIFNECICSTAGGTAAKVTNTVPTSFSLVSGAKIIVKFTYAITVANATLQVGETAAKPIRIMGAALDANVIKAGTSVLLSYDGTAYNIIGGVGGNDVDVNYDATNKKITKTINGVTSDVVTAEKIVTDGGAAIEPEVEIGETAPTGTPKLFVDEDADPAVSIDVYTRAQVDAKIAEAPEQSTINATDYVVLKDTDGVNRKISKANMMSVVKDALADLLRNNDLGTDVTNVPALSASAFGSATISNLASVLGIRIFTTMASTTVRNKIVKSGSFIFVSYEYGGKYVLLYCDRQGTEVILGTLLQDYPALSITYDYNSRELSWSSSSGQYGFNMCIIDGWG